MRLRLQGDVAPVLQGVGELVEFLGIQLAEDGYPLRIIQKDGPLSVSNHQGQGEIIFQESIHFFRGLGLWQENLLKQESFSVTEYPQFKTTGAMLDVSRNAVLTVAGIKDMLRYMAVMGLNQLMLYTEDTYEVKEYSYFGYMRGRYTEEELQECDDFATGFGIEMIPCIQALAHLTEALKWNYAIDMRDTADILLVDEPKTYAFLENIITAATKPFRSKRIHIGMDEAHQLGRGKYLDVNGYQERFQIMNRHLNKVVAITEKLMLTPMIWSDMYFRLGSKTGTYYDLEATIPDDAISSIPDTQLVYWDYYHEDKDFYTTFIEKHKQLKPNPIFAGGVWTWNGIAPNYGKAISTTEAALAACKETGVQEVFATMWGDNGAETPITTALPILQLYAEHAYHRQVTEEHVAERFLYCVGASMEDFMLFNKLDETRGVAKGNPEASNPSKLLLWQDILLGLYDENISGLFLGDYYTNLLPEMTQATRNNSKWRLLFEFYEQLTAVLALKADSGLRIKDAYDRKDTHQLNNIIEELAELTDAMHRLRRSHRTVWFSMNKAFGWEILEIRYGGVVTRIDTVQHRLRQWIEGEIEKIEELEEERLHFEGPYPMSEGTVGRNLYHRIVTAGNL